MSSLSSREIAEQPQHQGAEDSSASEQVAVGGGIMPPEKSESTVGSVSGVSLTPQPIEVKVPEEVMERISRLEDEIKKVRDDLSTVSEGLRNAVIEFKEIIAEASSPFSLLKRDGNGGGNGKSKANGAQRIAPSTFVELLKVVDAMLSEMDKETVIALLSSYVKAGVIGETVGASLAEIVELAYIMKCKGISVEKQLPYLYALAQALRIEDQSLATALLKEVIRRGNLG